VTTSDHPKLCGIVVNWFDEDHLADLVEAWPADEDLELLIVDNGSTRDLPARAQILDGGRNLGFAGAINLGLQNTQAPLVLVMNSDVCPQPGALGSLIQGFERWPDAAALAPRLVSADGSSQYRWQLRSLPSVSTLLLQALLLPATGQSRSELGPGQQVDQPAAAALVLRRQVLAELEGFDETFFPAWFEDVDLAKRMQDSEHRIRYCPEAEFTHHLGSSIPRLGYGRFLRIYYSNLCRYLGKHHGMRWARMARHLLIPASLLRLALLPIRCPKRAGTRREAALGLWRLAVNAASGWQESSTDLSPDGSSSDQDGTP
jgi:GT2 family glycosyltransferase